jgi:hypothetical protein
MLPTEKAKLELEIEANEFEPTISLKADSQTIG